MTQSPYLFTSARLGFRTWKPEDLDPFSRINASKEVMNYFPSPLSKEETAAFITRMQEVYNQYGYCYFATELMETKQLIGFIGLNVQDFEAPFCPCTDIGWRLAPEFWHRGFATEGAIRCLEYGFEELNLETIYAIAPVINEPSIRVMQKIGMKPESEFEHPKLKDTPSLERCVLYKARP